jgi:hypothetical protein
LFSLDPYPFGRFLCLLCACYLRSFAGLHYALCPLTQLANERRVLLFHRFDGIPEYFATS